MDEIEFDHVRITQKYDADGHEKIIVGTPGSRRVHPSRPFAPHSPAFNDLRDSLLSENPQARWEWRDER